MVFAPPKRTTFLSSEKNRFSDPRKQLVDLIPYRVGVPVSETVTLPYPGINRFSSRPRTEINEKNEHRLQNNGGSWGGGKPRRIFFTALAHGNHGINTQVAFFWLRLGFAKMWIATVAQKSPLVARAARFQEDMRFHCPAGPYQSETRVLRISLTPPELCALRRNCGSVFIEIEIDWFFSPVELFHSW